MCELVFALLCDTTTKASPRRLGARLKRSPGYLSTVLSSLAAEGLVDENGFAVVPELFWALSEAWPRDWVMLTDEPATLTSDGLVSGVHGALAWGAPETYTNVVEGAFQFSALWCGTALVALQPERGERRLREAEYHDVSRVPCHAYIAFYLWLRTQGVQV